MAFLLHFTTTLFQKIKEDQDLFFIKDLGLKPLFHFKWYNPQVKTLLIVLVLHTLPHLFLN